MTPRENSQLNQHDRVSGTHTFDGDGVLSVILSKVLLLAADDKITDPAILLQLQRRA